MSMQTGRRVGVAFVGHGWRGRHDGDRGIELIKSGANRLDGLPLADISVAGMTDYRDIVFGGWDCPARSRRRRDRTACSPPGHRRRRPGARA